MRLFLLANILFLQFPLLAQQFPQTWEGKWRGQVQIWSNNQAMDAFPMSLEITRKDTAWDYIITYEHNRSDKPDIRNYTLFTINDSIGHFGIDEHNSIILDSYYNDGCLYSSFGGLGSDLGHRICMRNGQMEYEFVSNFSEPYRVGGDTIIGNDTIARINSYFVYSIMKAQLKKQ